MNAEGDLESTHLKRLIDILGRYTRTPDDCFFGLWEGFGDIHGVQQWDFFAGAEHGH